MRTDSKTEVKNRVELSSGRSKANASAPLVFAVAPFEKDEDRLQQMKKTVQAMKLWRGDRDNRKELGSPILPVSIVSPADLSLPERIGPPMEDAIVDMAVSSVDLALDKVLPSEPLDRSTSVSKKAISKLKSRPKIEFSQSTSKRQSAEALLQVAKDSGAELIAVSTHGRKGLERVWLGSFAETLAALSSIPVLTVNPQTEISSSVRRVFVPTDLSEASHRAFASILKVAARLGAEVTLYYIHHPPVPLFIDGGYPADAVALETMWRESEQNQKSLGASWAKEAEIFGVKCRFVFSKEIGATGELLVKAAAREKADLIGLTSSRGPVSQAILGGSVRVVMATARCPVFIVHASPAAKKRSAGKRKIQRQKKSVKAKRR